KNMNHNRSIVQENPVLAFLPFSSAIFQTMTGESFIYPIGERTHMNWRITCRNHKIICQRGLSVKVDDQNFLTLHFSKHFSRLISNLSCIMRVDNFYSTL